MADSKATAGLREQALNNPAVGRLVEELREYAQARAERLVTDLGQRLGEAAKQLADPSSGAKDLLGPLAEAGRQLGEGKSPGRIGMSLGAAGVRKKLTDKAKGLFGKDRGKSGAGEGKSVVVIEDVDVGVPLRHAYNQWTRYQEFGRFAKGVVSVERKDDTTTNWQVKVAKANRAWRARITEQVPDQRIAWTSEGAKGTTKGVVTFHPLGDNLTKVLLVLEYFPKGLIEKTGNIWRAQGRRARLDLKLYRKFVMMRGEADEGWRGEIRDGEVVLSHEDAERREREEHEEPRAGQAAEKEEEAEAPEEQPEERGTPEAGGEPRPAGEPGAQEETEREEEPREEKRREEEPRHQERRGQRPHDDEPHVRRRPRHVLVARR
ncbi:SRPBCC family protein [Allostreptomyces psammosilenae]|uniref:Coenzyme Q-binding protein COQ10 START domain-containing protein n=1 Tax=Allostreptomyces psammosilenae TaxID=1892865 RepID=A0A852ZT99_9ACTN|nr:SRPBCC family protein [Allostreptomyces psammosilenae]NYI05065.1 hypothetical protein [Allostreptomyces psammosilenae]